MAQPIQDAMAQYFELANMGANATHALATAESENEFLIHMGNLADITAGVERAERIIEMLCAESAMVN